MKIFGQLEKAQIENLTADPTGLGPATVGLIWFRTDLERYRAYTGTVIVEFADLTSAQTFTNKIFSGGTVDGSSVINAAISSSDINLGTATDTNKIVVSANTTANIEALTREAGSIYYSTDEEKYFGDDGVDLIDLGGGGLGDADTYELETFEEFKIADIESTGQNATYKVTGTFGGALTLETAAPIAGEQSLRYTAGAASTNDWFNIKNVNVKAREKATTNAREIWVDATNFSVDFDLIMYNISDGVAIEEARQTIVGGSSLKKYAVPFDLVNTASIISYGVHLNNAPVDTEYILFDQVRLSVDPFAFMNISNNTNLKSEGAITIEAVTTNPTKGTVTVDDVSWRREGQYAVIEYRYAQAGAGGNAGSGDYIFNLPDGLIADTNLAPIFTDPNIFTVPNRILETSGYITSSSGPVAGPINSAVMYSPNSFRLMGQRFFVSGNLAIGSGNYPLTQGIAFGFTIRVPILGWSATTESVATPSRSNMFDTRIVQGITIEATTTNPTKGTVETDEIQYSQIGDKGIFKYNFKQTTSGTDGSGDYLYSLPDGLEFSDDIPISTTGSNAGDLSLALASIGAGSFSISSSSGVSTRIVPYDSTRFRLIMQTTTGSANTQRPGWFQLSLANLTFSFEFIAPIKGWTSENQFLSLIPVQKTAYLKDVKPSGTAGGTFTSGSYQTRDINTVEGDSEIVSLSSNQFTLPAGIYELEALAPAIANGAAVIGTHKIKLRNITDSSDDIIGTSSVTQSQGGTSVAVSGNAVLKGRVELLTSKTFEIQHRCVTTATTLGFGAAASFGDDEVYSQVKITKVK